MAPPPFLEIKVNTHARYLIQELFRLCEGFRTSSALQVDWIWVRVSDLRLQTNLATNEAFEPDIAELTDTQIGIITQQSETTWTLFFNTLQEGERWKAHFDFELRAIGGSHPLLVAFQSCSQELYPLLGDVLERCGSLWDAQWVHHTPDHSTLRHFFKAIVVRQYPWLSALERRYYGDVFERFAPGSVRSQEEQARREAAGNDARTQKPEEPRQESPQSQVDTDAQEALSTEIPQGSAPAQSVDSTTPPEPTPDADAAPTLDRKQPGRMYGPTEEKIALVRQLLVEKQQGRHRNKPWSWACEQATLDLKTAQKHLASERTEWDALNARDQGRAGPRGKPKQ